MELKTEEMNNILNTLSKSNEALENLKELLEKTNTSLDEINNKKIKGEKS